MSTRNICRSRAAGTSGNIGRFMVFIGPISSIFDFTTFCMMLFVFDAEHVGAAVPVPDRLVRRVAADADADHPHHPHAEDSVHPEPRGGAAAGDDRQSSWRWASSCRWGRSPHTSNCRRCRRCTSRPGGDPAGVYDADPGDEGLLCPPVRLAVDSRTYFAIVMAGPVCQPPLSRSSGTADTGG